MSDEEWYRLMAERDAIIEPLAQAEFAREHQRAIRAGIRASRSRPLEHSARVSDEFVQWVMTRRARNRAGKPA